MGFNISGVAVNKNYKDNFEELQKDFDWNLIEKEEINFEEASSNWKEEGICDVYFTERGTLIFINMDLCTQAWETPYANTLTFALSEASMAFNLNYCLKGKEVRSIMEVNGNRVDDSGEKLQVESKSEDISEVIWNQIEDVSGKSFWEIQPNEKAFRFKFASKSNLKSSDNKKDNSQQAEIKNKVEENTIMDIEQILNDSFIECPNCKADFEIQPDKCDNCAYPFNGTEKEKSQFIAQQILKKNKLSDTKNSIKKTRIILFIIGGLNIVIPFAKYFFNESDSKLNILNLIVGLTFLGFAFAIKKNPLISILIPFIILVIFYTIAAIAEPSSIFSGIIWKILFLGSMIYSLVNIYKSEKIKKENKHLASSDYK